MNNDNTPQVNLDEALITVDQLREMGINLPEQQLQELATHVQNTINERIGEEVVESLTGEQLEELIAMQDSGAPGDQISEWLCIRVPDYEQIVEDNTIIVLGEVVDDIDAIQQPKSEAGRE